jgi:hypothetical protein
MREGVRERCLRLAIEEQVWKENQMQGKQTYDEVLENYCPHIDEVLENSELANLGWLRLESRGQEHNSGAHCCKALLCSWKQNIESGNDGSSSSSIVEEDQIEAVNVIGEDVARRWPNQLKKVPTVVMCRKNDDADDAAIPQEDACWILPQEDGVHGDVSSTLARTLLLEVDSEISCTSSTPNARQQLGVLCGTRVASYLLHLHGAHSLWAEPDSASTSKLPSSQPLLLRTEALFLCIGLLLANAGYQVYLIIGLHMAASREVAP